MSAVAVLDSRTKQRASTAIRYHEFAPRNEIAHLVARFWIMTTGDEISPNTEHRVLPDGCVDLIVVAKRNGATFMTVRGPQLAPLIIPIDSGDSYYGARLWPDAGALLVGKRAVELVDRMYPAMHFFGEAAQQLANHLRAEINHTAIPALWETWLESISETMSPIDPAVRLAIVAINAANGGLSTAEIGSIVALSPRQLQRRFKSATGLTVKSYARIRRMRQSIGHLLRGDVDLWSAVAARLRFSDQSHLVSEFNRLAGLPPGDVAEYVRQFTTKDVIP
jgi:AraC-like DNA-binding protein